MFYSHEILTSRKHGVATVWLVATLGSRSNLKKVSRRAILDVDVSRACQTIADPESPMALRLQSSLLYGVSRVFSQQCGYILADTQSLHDKMRGMPAVVRDLQLDKSVALTSNEQLNLPFDPAFNVEVDLGLDLANFDISRETAEQSSFFSPRSLPFSQSSFSAAEGIEQQLELISNVTRDSCMSGFDAGPDFAISSIHRTSHVEDDLEGPAIDMNPTFEVGDDDMIVDLPLVAPDISDAHGLVVGGDVDQGAGPATPTNLLQVSLQDIQGTADDNQDYTQFLTGDDDVPALPLVDPQVSDLPALSTPSLSQFVPSRPSTIEPSIETHIVEFPVEAAQRRARPKKLLEPDMITELSNRQLALWQEDYTDTMAQARLDEAYKQSRAQARRNAAFWVLEQGIGNANVNFGDDREEHPLLAFSGQALIDDLVGLSTSHAGRKRPYSLVGSDSDDDQHHEVRRQHTSAENDVERDIDSIVFSGNDDGIMLQGDEEVEVEVGRQPASSLKDHPSSMPWNTVGSSRQGSIQRSGQLGFASGMRSTGAEHIPSSIFPGRRSRLTPASPLFGRGQPPPRLGSVGPQGSLGTIDISIDNFPNPFSDLTGNDDDDFELYGPAAAVSTQQAAQSQWLATTLENEAHNFLLFLDEKITNRDHSHNLAPNITFADLLPPAQNSNIVAAQGILHVLALATKGLVSVQQQEAFGDITLAIVRSDDLLEEDNAVKQDGGDIDRDVMGDDVYM